MAVADERSLPLGLRAGKAHHDFCAAERGAVDGNRAAVPGSDFGDQREPETVVARSTLLAGMGAGTGARL